MLQGIHQEPMEETVAMEGMEEAGVMVPMEVTVGMPESMLMNKTWISLCC